LSWQILDAFREAAASVGIPKSDDFNCGDNFGCGYFEVNQRRGFRWSTARAFLKPASQRGNLEIMTGCHVKRLITEKTDHGIVCRGVEFTGGGNEWRAEANAETLLTAGAIGTPQILQLSGIGPAALLKEHGIPVLLDVPGVGENLQDHLQLRMIFKLKGAKTLNTMAATWLGKMKIGLEYVLRRSGPMSMAPSQLGAFAKSNLSEKTANLEYHVQPLSLDKFGDPLHPFPAFTASVCNLRPTSRGNVRIASHDPLDAPKLTLNYLSTAEDRSVAIDAIKLTRKIVSAPPMQMFVPIELKPGVHYRSDEELVNCAADIGTTIFHPVGTCKMGAAQDQLAVVDSELRVRGINRLRIVDASIMPTITSGNTNSPTIMIAERAAQLIKAGRA
jgi:choline dehydrogenase